MDLAVCGVTAFPLSAFTSKSYEGGRGVHACLGSPLSLWLLCHGVPLSTVQWLLASFSDWSDLSGVPGSALKKSKWVRGRPETQS